MTKETEAEYLTWLVRECGYRDVRSLGNGRFAAISPLMFTHAIIVGKIGDRYAYDDRWCYHDHASALAALNAWDGTGEPEGWHRHPASGRRRNGGEEYLEP